MNLTINYADLVSQKTTLLKKLHDLDAREFGATSLSEMDQINRERKDVEAAIRSINKILAND